MRMVEPEKLRAKIGGLALRFPIISRAHQEPPSWTLLGGVRQRHHVADATVAADHRTATLVRVGGLPVLTDCRVDRARDEQVTISHRRSRNSRSDISPRRPE